MRSAAWILVAIPLLWAGCAKNNPTGNDVILNKAGQLIAKNGFIASGQRVAELQTGPHAALACGDCHSNALGGPAINRHCPDCHPAEAQHMNHPNIETSLEKMCVRCHMPYATLDRSINRTNKYVADVHTHVFRLRATTERRSSMLVPVDGGQVVIVDGGITLDLACYQCHQDPNGGGGGVVQEYMEVLVGMANAVHRGATPGASKETR